MQISGKKGIDWLYKWLTSDFEKQKAGTIQLEEGRAVKFIEVTKSIDNILGGQEVIWHN
jgi:hypothetical protein